MIHIQLYVTIILSFICYSTLAQGVTIGNSAPPHPSAVLDIQSTQAGLLLPRLTLVQRNAIVSPAAGLQIYNMDTDCLEMYFAGGGWRKIYCGCTAYPNANFALPTAYVNTQTGFSTSVANMQYQWSFQQGNPANSAIPNPTVSWSSAGNYVVSLTLTDSAGCSATHTDTLVVANCPGPAVDTFFYTGNVQTFTVPPCVTSITIDAYGAQGYDLTYGGKGGRVMGTRTVTPGEVLYIYVGGYGSGAGGGWNGGESAASGSGCNGTSGGTGYGGGATDVRVGGTGLNQRILVAGGGGASGLAGPCTGPTPTMGGAGGGSIGGAGTTSSTATGGGGGTQSAGGSAGSGSLGAATAGSLGQGGDRCPGDGIGDGGGGFYGGGGGGASSGCHRGGGGGGSSFTGGITPLINQQGVRGGHGLLIIQY